MEDNGRDDENEDDYKLAVIKMNPDIFEMDSRAELAKLREVDEDKPKVGKQFASRGNRDNATLPETPQDENRPPSFSENSIHSVYRVKTNKHEGGPSLVLPPQQDTKVFEFDSDHYKKTTTIEEQEKVQPAFSPIKEQAQRFEYGDPKSEEKLKFLQKINALNKADNVFSNYDSLGGPPPQADENVYHFEYNDMNHYDSGNQ